MPEKPPKAKIEKQRLDILLVERGFAESRQKAQAILLAGEVRVNGQRHEKPGERVATDAQIEITGTQLRYVSRGGIKLEGALDDFGVAPTGEICLDVAFISVAKVLPAVVAVTGPSAEFLILIKPQFELDRGDIGKGGIVRDAKLHERAIERVRSAALTAGLTIEGVKPSRLPGAEGNQEFFLHALRTVRKPTP